MIGIMMAYWRDARIQTAKGRAMLYSTGLKRTLYDRVLDALEDLLDKPAGKRAARWSGAVNGFAGRMTQQKNSAHAAATAKGA